MADCNPWSETPTYSVYVPPDQTSLKNRIHFLIGSVKKKSQEINNLMFEIEQCNKQLNDIEKSGKS